jgi:hypothetical protein
VTTTYLSLHTTTVPAGQQLEDVLGMGEDCYEESEDREKHDDTYNEGLCIATEGEYIPGYAKILQCNDDRRRKKEDLYTSAGLVCGS